MLLHIIKQCLEGILPEKANREARRIRGQAKHIKVPLWVKCHVLPLYTLSMDQLVHCISHIAFADRRIHGKQCIHCYLLVGGLTACCPADNGGIAHALNMFPVCQQIV